MLPPRPTSTLFPYTTLFRSCTPAHDDSQSIAAFVARPRPPSAAAPKPVRVAPAVFHASRFCCADCTIRPIAVLRSEEHTSELQSREKLVCRLLLEKTNITVH